MSEATYDAATLNAKLERWRIEGNHHKPYALCEGLIAERDRLRKDLNDIGEDYHRLAAENAELWKERLRLAGENAILRIDIEEDRATLDRLRELVGPNRTISNSTCMNMVAILYPPETPNDQKNR